MKMLLIILITLVPSILWAQSFKDVITRELAFEKKDAATLMVLNINGHVRVEGYTGDKVQVEVNRQIYGKTEARLELGKKEIQLGVIDRADTIILYVQGYCNNFGKLKNRGQGNRHGGWGYDWNCNGGDCNKDYEWEMDFTIKVPQGVNVVASTVNNGNVEVRSLVGRAAAENVNGSIRLDNLSGPSTYASTINGDVDVDYTRNPTQDCRYYSLNGDVNVLFVKGLTADVAFESFNGNLFTNVDRLESMPAVVRKQSSNKGLAYKVGGARYKIGQGGVFLDFETFNGNAYIKEK